jgi:crossover junction endodeoxyribonuclease RuvC
MRVLGIDPGSRITGYGIIEATGDRLVHVASGCLKITANDLPQRMGTILKA